MIGQTTLTQMREIMSHEIDEYQEGPCTHASNKHLRVGLGEDHEGQLHGEFLCLVCHAEWAEVVSDENTPDGVIADD